MRSVTHISAIKRQNPTIYLLAATHLINMNVSVERLNLSLNLEAVLESLVLLVFKPFDSETVTL